MDGSGDVGRYWEAPVMVSYAYMEKDMVQVCTRCDSGAGGDWLLSVLRHVHGVAWRCAVTHGVRN